MTTTTPMDQPTVHILPDAAQRYADMSRAFDKARLRSAGDFDFTLSGVPTRLRTAGNSLFRQMVRPFNHLAAGENPPAPRLRIDLWDETETGVGCRSCAIDESVDEWGIWKCSADGRFLIYCRKTAFEIYDRQEQRILGWSTGHLHVSHNERGRPLLRHMMQWHLDAGMHVIHGALVACDGIGVLIVGKGGSGKSTTALQCTLEGMDFLSEDFLSIGRSPDGGFVGHSIYGSAKLHPDHILRFPRLGEVAVGPENPDDDKLLLFVQDLRGARLMKQVKIGVVLAPKVTQPEADCRMTPIGRGAALMQLAPNTLVLLNRCGLGIRRGEVVARNMDEFAALLAACPSYRLELGSIETVVPAVREIIKPLRAAAFGHA